MGGGGQKSSLMHVEFGRKPIKIDYVQNEHDNVGTDGQTDGRSKHLDSCWALTMLEKVAKKG